MWFERATSQLFLIFFGHFLLDSHLLVLGLHHHVVLNPVLPIPPISNHLTDFIYLRVQCELPQLLLFLLGYLCSLLYLVQVALLDLRLIVQPAGYIFVNPADFGLGQRPTHRRVYLFHFVLGQDFEVLFHVFHQGLQQLEEFYFIVLGEYDVILNLLLFGHQVPQLLDLPPAQVELLATLELFIPHDLLESDASILDKEFSDDALVLDLFSDDLE